LRLAQYANALAKQDVPTQQAARTNVRGFTDEFANGFVQANAQLPALTINGWGDTLSRFAINLIDAQDARNFAQEYQLRAQTNQQLLQLTNVLGQSIGQQFPDRYGIPSAPAVPANVGSATDDSNVASGSTTDASATAGTGGATTDTGTADVTGATTAGSTTDTDTAGTATAGDASAASSTVLLPQTGAALSSSVYQVTGTTTTTGTDATGTDATGAGTSVTGTTTTTGTTQSGSVLLPQTGADLSSTVYQVTGTATTTGTDATGAGTSVTGTTTTTGTTTGDDANTTGSGTVLLPQSGADLSSIAQQVTGTVTTTPTTGTAGAGTTTTDTVTGTVSGDDANMTGSDVLLPQAGADLSQQQQGGQPNTFVPIALVIAGIALIMAVVLMSFARRDYGQQKRDQ
jgi:hypothetical protein